MSRSGIPPSLLREEQHGQADEDAAYEALLDAEAAEGSSTDAIDVSRAARTAAPRRLGAVERLRSWGEHHLQAMFNTLGRMVRMPFSTLMTVAVIGIALALPTGLYVVLQGARAVSAGWEDAAQISLFLRKSTPLAQIDRLVREIGASEQVATVAHIPPAAALEEFQRLSGFGEALDILQDNPLPSVLIVQPRVEAATPQEIESLLARLRAVPAVESAQLDLEWVKRFYAIMQFAQRGVLVLGAFLALSVLLIIGNTIRLSIQSRREEIVVQKLIGATNSFVRRPFLYNGVFHGLFGAIFAWLLVTAALGMLAGPVRRLSALYDSDFTLGGISAGVSLVLLGGG
ncbi:MAG: permease-like cell division protein FtsX, partial [Chromatiales bacterium]|nr:permease-like cell division protein FtsX [Chromatiales bacterium]